MFKLTRFSVLCLSLGALTLSGLAAAQEAKTACVSMQGNGERYPALIAQVLALMERNIEPKVIFGGSSASGAASLIRGILENPSIDAVEIVVEGHVLSRAEKAARIVATTPRPIGTILVLPGFNKLGHTFSSVIKYVGADQLAQAFIGYPDQSIANLEAAVGQISLLAEYFATADFTAALQEPNLVKRSEIVMNDWLRFSDMTLVTPHEFIRALITGPKDPLWTARSESLKKRYFDLFYDETAASDQQPDPSRERYNNLLNTLQPIIAKIPDDQLEKAFLSSISLLKGLPFVAYTAVVASKPFYLANGLRIQNAYKGLASDGRSLLNIPSGTLIHTTARVAEMKSGNLVEKTGLDSFYQAYFPSADLSSDLLAARAALGAHESFMQLTDANGQTKAVIAKDHLLVLEPKTLAAALKVSVAEPNAFRRDALPLSSQDLTNNGLILGKNTLVTFGGWLEHANRRTIASLDVCQNVDYVVEVSTLSQGLYDFQLKAIRAVIAGGTGSLLGQITGSNKAADEASKLWMNDLWKSFSDSHSVRPAAQSLNLNFDWDNASGLQGAEATAMNPAYDANRNAFFVRAYQYTSDRLNTNANVAPSLGAMSILGADLNRLPLGAIKDPSQLNGTVDSLLQ